MTLLSYAQRVVLRFRRRRRSESNRRGTPLPPFDIPIDGGRTLRGKPLLGSHKSAVVFASLVDLPLPEILLAVAPIAVLWRLGLKQACP